MTVAVPDATADADSLFSKLMKKLAERDFEPTLEITLSTSKAHWVQDGVLHICFDKDGQNLYNYANDASMRTILQEAAKQSIAPITVELEIRREGPVKQKSVKELFGVPIEEI